ncbi:hypothetical protein PBI_ANJALI_22 [Arthrobacter phage Anjali]|uniref:Uncharacterized protein n=1 Tax=Arthrobacter phage Anjali TaxID=2484217 RepID=A0A3G3LXV1_9CAUD|nr:hypothetical protein HWB95_gp22 [Arthrobacter phage Anjali]AYQ98992.1 hypothetical protein PBI_ANJALI_22 [Arthrobacter phage Anjali]
MNASQIIGKCPAGHVVRGTSESDNYRGGWIKCGCGRQAIAKFMNVTVKPEKTCNGVCTGATGPSCSCSCGGENHGSGKVF